MKSDAGPRIRQLIQRILLVWGIDVLALLLLAQLIPGLSLETAISAVLTIAFLGLLNALVRPLFLRFTLRFAVMTFGLSTLVGNTGLFMLISELGIGLEVTNVGIAFATALGLVAINTILISLLALNDEDSFYYRLVRYQARRSAYSVDSNEPGLIFLEIDGLAAPVLHQAIRDGYMPMLTKWVRSGTHHIVSWDCGVPSQTSSSQAGILYGSNFDIPAFRWYEKDTQRLFVSDRPKDAADIEERVSTGTGLLNASGFSVGNLLSGDAGRSALTVSIMGSGERGGSDRSAFYRYYVNPYNFPRTLVLMLWEILLEVWQGRRQRLRDVEPRVSRRLSFVLLRAASTVALRDMSIYILMGEVLRGVRVAYATLVGYDVLAHHAGITRRETMNALYDLDHQIARLVRAAEHAPRPYNFVILSDHGQSQGATFYQRYGLTLEQLVQSLLQGDLQVQASIGEDESWAHLNQLLSDAAQTEKLSGRAARRALRRRVRDGQIELGPDHKRPQLEQAKVVVCASGNLGLVYFTDWLERMSLEEIEANYPGLIEGLVGHEGIGFLMVHSRQHGPIVMGKSGIHYLENEHVEGTDPLKNLGINAANHLRCMDSFPHIGDIVVNSMYDPATEEVAAFEELVGSHGGLGGQQTEPFLMFPSEWEEECPQIVGAIEMHELLKRWLRHRSSE